MQTQRTKTAVSHKSSDAPNENTIFRKRRERSGWKHRFQHNTNSPNENAIPHSAKGGAVEKGCSDLYDVIY